MNFFQDCLFRDIKPEICQFFFFFFPITFSYLKCLSLLSIKVKNCSKWYLDIFCFSSSDYCIWGLNDRYYYYYYYFFFFFLQLQLQNTDLVANISIEFHGASVSLRFMPKGCFKTAEVRNFVSKALAQKKLICKFQSSLF